MHAQENTGNRRHRDAAPFRVWPPISLGIPLTGGVALSILIGEPMELPSFRRGVAVLLGVVFAVWNGWGLVLFHRHSTGLLPGQPTTELLSTGPFAVSRNPLYLGLIVLYIAIALAVPSSWALLLLPLGVVALSKGAIAPEEAYLLAKFGAPYAEYCRRVPRWL